MQPVASRPLAVVAVTTIGYRRRMARAGDQAELELHVLRPHPAAPRRPGVTVIAAAVLTPAELRCRFVLRGALARLVVPPPAKAPARRDELWRRTCLEAFVGARVSSAYVEANFAPSGDWALYAFDDRRSGMRPLPLASAPALSWTRIVDDAVLDARIALEPLAALLGDPPWDVGLSAVLEHDGAQSLLALAHPAPQPDFHHRSGWTLAVYPAPRA